MKRALIPLILLAFLPAACGNGNEPGDAGNAPAGKASRLVGFDAGKLAEGMQLPDFTGYWTLAEQRNGNIYPVKAAVDERAVKAVRLGADGAFAEYRGGEFHSQSLAGISSGMETLAKREWNEKEQASGAALILFADARAPYTSLLKLCRELVDLQVRNLWLVTHDDRDDALRLLPLKVDVEQVFNEWYALPKKAGEVTLRFSQETGEETSVGMAWASSLGKQVVFTGDGWRDGVRGKLDFFKARATRVQFELPGGANIGNFAEVANLLAPVGYNDVEPFWPALEAKPDEPEVVKPRRQLVVFDDKLGAANDLQAPTMSDFWRASAADRGLPAAAKPDPDLPLLAIRATAAGKYATRTREAPDWTQHSDDQEVVEAMQRNSGEIDFDTGKSDLQVLLCIDRDARWEAFTAVLEMAHLSLCRRVFVVTSDILGPTLRLLDLSFPAGEDPAEDKVSAVNVDRVGAVVEADYRVEMLLDGEKHNTTGSSFPSTLARWATERKKDPEVLYVKMPRDEPVQTFFNVLNSLAWLGMHSIRIGG